MRCTQGSVRGVVPLKKNFLDKKISKGDQGKNIPLYILAETHVLNFYLKIVFKEITLIFLTNYNLVSNRNIHI
jgi:hypothetical protein